MRDEKVVGLGRVVLARRERIMMLDPYEKGLVGTVLRYSAEVRSATSYFEDVPDLKLPEEMKDLAHVIIQRKAGHFHPEEFTDRYEDAVVALIRAKQEGLPARPAAEPSRPSNVVNIMDALRKSIAAEGGAAPGQRPSGGKPPEEAVEAAPKPKAPSKAKGASGKAVAAQAAKTRKAR
jgi:DNA end-binding protein Ku